MVTLYCLLTTPGFYFKLIELGLAIAGTIIFTCFVIWPYAQDRQTMIAMSLAMPNAVLTTFLLVLLMVYEVQGNYAELCLNGTAGVINIAMAVALFCHLGSNATGIFVSLAVICACLGAIMIIDTARLAAS